MPPTAAAERVTLPGDLRRYVPQEDPPSTDPIEVTVLQTAISAEAAAALDKSVGDLLFLSFDARDPLSQRQLRRRGRPDQRHFEVNDASDPFWFDDQSLNHVSGPDPRRRLPGSSTSGRSCRPARTTP